MEVVSRRGEIATRPLGAVTVAVARGERTPVAAAARLDRAASGAARAEATCLARDLARTPGQDLVPERLAERAREIGAGAGGRVRVLGVPEMECLGMGAILAVGRGSVHPPRFIVLEREAGAGTTPPRPAARGRRAGRATPPTVVVIGKGVTFDTGGISLKPADGMHKMKYDMSGAAAAVVDLATLTGAIGVALGNEAAGLFTADEPLAGELLAAAAASGERLWRMPLWDDYAMLLTSDIADVANAAGQREGGACTAAAFLRRFAKGLRWAHLDIASTAWSPADRPHESRGATGFGVRLLLEWISRRASAPDAAP